MKQSELRFWGSILLNGLGLFPLLVGLVIAQGTPPGKSNANNPSSPTAPATAPTPSPLEAQRAQLEAILQQLLQKQAEESQQIQAGSTSGANPSQAQTQALEEAQKKALLQIQSKLRGNYQPLPVGSSPQSSGIEDLSKTPENSNSADSAGPEISPASPVPVIRPISPIPSPTSFFTHNPSHPEEVKPVDTPINQTFPSRPESPSNAPISLPSLTHPTQASSDKDSQAVAKFLKTHDRLRTLLAETIEAWGKALETLVEIAPALKPTCLPRSTNFSGEGLGLPTKTPGDMPITSFLPTADFIQNLMALRTLNNLSISTPQREECINQVLVTWKSEGDIIEHTLDQVSQLSALISVPPDQITGQKADEELQQVMGAKTAGFNCEASVTGMGEIVYVHTPRPRVCALCKLLTSQEKDSCSFLNQACLFTGFLEGSLLKINSGKMEGVEWLPQTLCPEWVKFDQLFTSIMADLQTIGDIMGHTKKWWAMTDESIIDENFKGKKPEEELTQLEQQLTELGSKVKSHTHPTPVEMETNNKSEVVSLLTAGMEYLKKTIKVVDDTALGNTATQASHDSAFLCPFSPALWCALGRTERFLFATKYPDCPVSAEFARQSVLPIMQKYADCLSPNANKNNPADKIDPSLLQLPTEGFTQPLLPLLTPLGLLKYGEDNPVVQQFITSLQNGSILKNLVKDPNFQRITQDPVLLDSIVRASCSTASQFPPLLLGVYPQEDPDMKQIMNTFQKIMTILLDASTGALKKTVSEKEGQTLGTNLLLLEKLLRKKIQEVSEAYQQVLTQIQQAGLTFDSTGHCQGNQCSCLVTYAKLLRQKLLFLEGGDEEKVNLFEESLFPQAKDRQAYHQSLDNKRISVNSQDLLDYLLLFDQLDLDYTAATGIPTFQGGYIKSYLYPFLQYLIDEGACSPLYNSVTKTVVNQVVDLNRLLLFLFPQLPLNAGDSTLDPKNTPHQPIFKECATPSNPSVCFNDPLLQGKIYAGMQVAPSESGAFDPQYPPFEYHYVDPVFFSSPNPVTSALICYSNRYFSVDQVGVVTFASYCFSTTVNPAPIFPLYKSEVVFGPYAPTHRKKMSDASQLVSGMSQTMLTLMKDGKTSFDLPKNKDQVQIFIQKIKDTLQSPPANLTPTTRSILEDKIKVLEALDLSKLDLSTPEDFKTLLTTFFLPSNSLFKTEFTDLIERLEKADNFKTVKDETLSRLRKAIPLQDSKNPGDQNSFTQLTDMTYLFEAPDRANQCKQLGFTPP